MRIGRVKLSILTFMFVTLLFLFLNIEVTAQTEYSALIYVQGATTTAIGVEPYENCHDVDENFIINVNITEAPFNKTWAWEFQMNWTASLLNLTGIIEGPFLSQSGIWSTYFAYDLNRTEGKVRVGSTLVEDPIEQDQTLPSDNGTLCTLNFTVLDMGTCDLDLYGTKLLDYYLVNYTHNVEDGYFSSVHDVAVIDILTWTNSSVPATSIPEDTLLYINVTAENQGGFSETFNVSLYYTRIVDPLIGTENVTLTSRANTTLKFEWTPNATGRYEILANTTEIPNDIDPTDNKCTTVVYVGDGNGNPNGESKEGSYVAVFLFSLFAAAMIIPEFRKNNKKQQLNMPCVVVKHNPSSDTANLWQEWMRRQPI